MGATSSRIAKKISNQFRSSSSDNVNDTSNENAVQKKGQHLVFSRRGSMYKDEDGDLAHEFYVEVPSTKQGGKATMKRIYDNLTPEGEVLYDIARLNSDFPNIISNCGREPDDTVPCCLKSRHFKALKQNPEQRNKSKGGGFLA